MDKIFTGDVRVEPRLIFGQKNIESSANRVVFFKDRDHHIGFDLNDVIAPFYYDDLRTILKDGNSISATLTLVRLKDHFGADLKLGSLTMESSSKIYTIDYTDAKRKPFIFHASDDLAALRSYACLLGFDLSTMSIKMAQSYGVSVLSRFYSENSNYLPIFPIEDEEYTKASKNLNINIYDFIR